MYSVVKFLDGEESYSEVPSIWLDDDGNKCWWPKSKSVSSFITKMVCPNKTDGRWTLYPVRVQKTTDDYELARKFADNYEDERGRGFRKKIGNSQDSFQESDSDFEQDNIYKEHLGLPNYPQSKKLQRKSQAYTQDMCLVSPNGKNSHNSNYLSVLSNNSADLEVDGNKSVSSNFLSVVSKNSSAGLKVVEIGVDPLSIAEEDEPTLLPEGDGDPTLLAEAINDGDVIEINKVDLSMVPVSTDRLVQELRADIDEQFIKTQRMLANVQATLERVMAIRGESQSTHPEDCDGLKEKALNLKAMFPIKFVDNLKDADKKIEADRELFKLLVKQLKLIGGSTLKDKIIRILRKIFTNELTAKASWLGHSRGETVNFKLSSLKIISAIREAIEDDPEFSEQKFEAICSDWVRQGKQRCKREEGKLNEAVEGT